MLLPVCPAPAIEAAPAGGPPVPAARAFARFRHPGGDGEIALDPSAADPIVARVAGHGAVLAAALVEALDRCAEGAQGPVVTGRGDVAVVLEGCAGWPGPRGLPSEILAGTSRGAAAGPAAPACPELDALRAAAGDEGLAALRTFAAARHELAADRRRLERRFWALDEHLRARTRNGVLFLCAAAAGVALALLGAVADLGGLAASGGMVGALAAAGGAIEALGRWPLREKRVRLRRGLATIVHREEALADAATRAARAAGADDAGTLADRVELLERTFAQSATPGVGARFPEIAFRLAAELALDPDAASRSVGAAGTGPPLSWPADLADAGSAPSDDASALAGLARFADRVERNLPAPWPLVLWEPWPTAAPAARTRRLRALARALPGRPLVVLMRG